jgi:hypothetical protein
MQKAKLVSTPLSSYFKLTKEMCPKTHEEIEYMSRVPYSSTFGILVYVMVCTRPHIAHVVGVVSRYMKNPCKEYWEAVKWILRYLKGTATHALCLEVHTLFYRNMLIHIWHVIKIVGGAP